VSNQMQVWAEKNREKIFALLPPQVSRERFLRNMVFQVSNNPSVASCDQRSIVQACLQATLHGLDIGILGSCYLVPFKGRAQLIIGYQGLLDLARRAGSLSAVTVECVRENDQYARDEKTFRHQWDPFEERGEIKGFYAILDLKDGSQQIETMSKAQVDSIRARSRASDKGPWVTDYEEMGKKTVLRRALKKIKLSIEEGQIIQQDDEASFENADVEVKKTSRNILQDAISAPPPGPIQVDIKSDEGEPTISVEVDPETGEVIPPASEEGPGPVGKTSPAKSPSNGRDLAVELGIANGLNEKLGFSKWRTFTLMRQRMVDARMKAEGIDDPLAFWRHVENVLKDVDSSYWESWTSGQNLETLIRVPSRRDVIDHFQRISEGLPIIDAAKNEPPPVNQTRATEMEGAVKDLWEAADEG
jgi:recombination protein RecT